jgi:O-antigen/teichoic acid export membrane protein
MRFPFGPTSEYGRNILTLMTGTTVMQAIPVAVSPILTRLYTPKEFGLYALFVSITAIVASVAGGRYELAVMLPKSDSQALNVVFLALLIVTGVSLAMLLFIFCFNARIAGWLGNKMIAPWLYLTPASVFFIGVYNTLKLYYSRQKQ